VNARHATLLGKRSYHRLGANVMVEKLRELFERVQQQPEDVQNRIAEVIQLELEEEADGYVPTAEELADIEASRAEYAAGHGRPYEEYVRERAARERR
jgi:hypothetical protein